MKSFYFLLKTLVSNQLISLASREKAFNIETNQVETLEFPIN
jgi:hypothetical protein